MSSSTTQHHDNDDNDQSLCFLTATQLIQGYKNRDFTPTQVTQQILRRIHQLNPLVRAYNFIEQEQVLLDQCQEALHRYETGTNRLLEGVPISVKDILMVTGWRTCYGSKAWVVAQSGQVDGGEVPVDTEDSPSVQRLKEAGAILVGKVTSPEFGWRMLCDVILLVCFALLCFALLVEIYCFVHCWFRRTCALWEQLSK